MSKITVLIRLIKWKLQGITYIDLFNETDVNDFPGIVIRKDPNAGTDFDEMSELLFISRDTTDKSGGVEDRN